MLHHGRRRRKVATALLAREYERLACPHQRLQSGLRATLGFGVMAGRGRMLQQAGLGFRLLSAVTRKLSVAGVSHLLRRFEHFVALFAGPLAAVSSVGHVMCSWSVVLDDALHVVHSRLTSLSLRAAAPADTLSLPAAAFPAVAAAAAASCCCCSAAPADTLSCLASALTSDQTCAAHYNAVRTAN
jgi:hypothetical protein